MEFSGSFEQWCGVAATYWCAGRLARLPHGTHRHDIIALHLTQVRRRERHQLSFASAMTTDSCPSSLTANLACHCSR